MTETLLIDFSKEDIVLALEDYYKKVNKSNKVVDFKFDDQKHLTHIIGNGISVKAIFYEEKATIEEIQPKPPEIAHVHGGFSGFSQQTYVTPTWISSAPTISTTQP